MTLPPDLRAVDGRAALPWARWVSPFRSALPSTHNSELEQVDLYGSVNPSLRRTGILRIDLEPEVPVILPVDWVDRLLKIAIDRGAKDFTERRLFECIAYEIGRAKA